MKIGAIVQARMSSKRYPGKVLHKISGKPVLQYLLERLKRCRFLDVIVATSRDETDIPIECFCKAHGIECYRGPLFNVAKRFKEVLNRYKFDAFVRVSGDSPLLDTRLIERGMDIFLNADYDIVTNALHRTYPTGQSVEIMRADTFCTAYELMQGDDELEHATRFFYKNMDKYKIFNFESGNDYSGIKLSIDTREDMNTFKDIVSNMKKPQWEYKLKDILYTHRELQEKC